MTINVVGLVCLGQRITQPNELTKRMNFVNNRWPNTFE